MRNTFLIDYTLNNKILTKLARICYARIRMKRIEDMLNQEIENNTKLMAKIKERNNVQRTTAGVWSIWHTFDAWF